MIYRHEHIYSIHLPILSMLSSGTCFQLSIPFMAPMLLYFYMIHIAFVSWLFCFPFPHTHVHHYAAFIYFHAPDGAIFLSHYTNYLIVFVLSRDIFYLCSIYTAKITEFVQWIYYKRTKEKAWHYFQTFTYTISLYKYYTLK